MPRLSKSNKCITDVFDYIWKYGRMVHGIICPSGWKLELRPWVPCFIFFCLKRTSQDLAVTSTVISGRSYSYGRIFDALIRFIGARASTKLIARVIQGRKVRPCQVTKSKPCSVI